jgi:pantoate--beta-alanine ligase
MQVTHDIPATRAAIARVREGILAPARRIGFVPTMGYLHAGHVSLIEAAKRDATFVVVSIFVNPTQFGPHEDYGRYPRDTAGDLAKCEAAGVDLVFLPPVEAMYNPDASTTVHVARLTDTLCGPMRPGHFDGVATVVAKLFNIVQPDRAYFGQKDAQQLAVIRRMVRDLDMPIEIVGCPTVREPDGLAMSSRNAMLSPDERQRALALYRALTAAREMVQRGESDPHVITAEMSRIVGAARPQRVDYISLVNPEKMQPVERISGPVLVALAVRIGQTRLIDNLLVDPAGPTA